MDSMWTASGLQFAHLAGKSSIKSTCGPCPVLKKVEIYNTWNIKGFVGLTEFEYVVGK